MTSSTPRVVVVGSLNLDHALTVPRLPGAGETLMATGVTRSPGGKGANQAVAAARAAGAHTSMVGALGDDEAGRRLRESLQQAGVDCSAVAVVDGPSGTAYITVDEHGENTIVVDAGANHHLGLDEAAIEAVASADVVLAQLEVPQEVLLAAASARSEGVPFVLNAAPSAPLRDDLLQQVDVLVVNEHEACDLADLDDLECALERLSHEVPCVVVTLGAAGARMLRHGTPTLNVRAPEVHAVDTVGAGDTFCGVLAAAFAAGLGDPEALQRSCAASSLAVQWTGAQESVPTHDEVDRQWRQSYQGH